MKKFTFLLLFLASIAQARTANNVYNMPASGNIPTWGPINLASGNAVTGLLPLTNLALTVPSIKAYTSTPTQVGYFFNLTSSYTVAAGCVFSAGGSNWTAVNAITSGNTIFMSNSSGTPTGAVLTYISGGAGCNGAANMNISTYYAYGLWTLPTSPTPLWLEVEIYGGGGGGSGSGVSSTGGAGGAGGASLFGYGTGGGLLEAGGGFGAAVATGGAGGNIILNSTTGIVHIRQPQTGAAGGSGQEQIGAGSLYLMGGAGGSSWMSGAGLGRADGGSGFVATPNTGSGGGGGSGQPSATNPNLGGGGGGSGAMFRAAISGVGLVTNYPIIVGLGGSGGSAGTTGNAGGAGATGYISIIPHFQ